MALTSILKNPTLDESNLAYITEHASLNEAAIDLSERSTAEMARHTKTVFLQNMQHEMRTPLSGIVNIAALIQSEAHNSNIQQYAENLAASSQALLNFLDEVLETVSISSGEIPLLKKKFNLQQTLEQIINLNRAKAQTKALKLSLDIDPKLPQFIIGDKVRIHRIGLELVANALNFTQHGHVTLKASLAKHQDRDIVIKLIVEDSGIGIAKAQQTEIYQQFKHITPSYQGIYKGSGLGLSIVKQFIEELSGEIYVQSESGQGSQFTCLIPLQTSLLDDETGVDTNLLNIDA